MKKLALLLIILTAGGCSFGAPDGSYVPVTIRPNTTQPATPSKP